MYRKFRNVPIFKDFPPICPYFLGWQVCEWYWLLMMIYDYDILYCWSIALPNLMLQFLLQDLIVLLMIVLNVIST